LSRKSKHAFSLSLPALFKKETPVKTPHSLLEAIQAAMDGRDWKTASSGELSYAIKTYARDHLAWQCFGAALLNSASKGDHETCDMLKDLWKQIMGESNMIKKFQLTEDECIEEFHKTDETHVINLEPLFLDILRHGEVLADTFAPFQKYLQQVCLHIEQEVKEVDDDHTGDYSDGEV
jgi:hypothetical protein